MKISVRKQRLLSYDRLVSLLDYDPIIGLFTWLVRRNNRIPVGSIAGTLEANGYVSITIDGVAYLAHRLAHFWMTGEWPSVEVDHQDTCRSNNRWFNIRPSTHGQNCHNTTLRVSNTSGITGVHWHTRNERWVAQIRMAGHRVALGSFKKKKDAIAAYRDAAIKYYGEYAVAA